MKDLAHGICGTMETQMDNGRLLNNPERSDIHFIVNHETLYAHRFILESKFELFKYRYPSTSSNEVIVIHPEASKQSILAMLRFYYTNEFSIDFGHAAELMAFAEKYKMEELRRVCASHISNQVTLDNVVDLYISANHYKVNGLKKACLQIIKESFHSVSKLDSFKKLSRHPDLTRELNNIVPRSSHHNSDMLHFQNSVPVTSTSSSSNFLTLAPPPSSPLPSSASSISSCHSSVSSTHTPSISSNHMSSTTNIVTTFQNAMQQFNVGSRCTLFGINGTVRYFGKTNFDEGKNYWVGLETDLPVGQHDGTVGSVRYFNSKPNHGLFIGFSLI